MNKKHRFIYMLVLSGWCLIAAAGTSGAGNLNDEHHQTPIEKQVKEEKISSSDSGLVKLYRPTYVLPFYYTGSPYYSIYQFLTPDGQRVKKSEFKAQFSFLIPLLHIGEDHPLALNFAYTQLMYWQLYTNSPYFRETNYEPEFFAEKVFSPNFLAQLGLNHQSNGRGGFYERSWNRVYGQISFSNPRWLIRLRAWTLIAKSYSSDLHNPQIAHFLGYDNLVIAHKWPNATLSVKLQNLESGLKRGFVEGSLSIPITPNISIFGQLFSGYGQSLIEYNHRTTSAGIGLALNDWI